MSRTKGIHKAILSGFIILGLSSTAFAQTSTPATGLGQAWPNATDLSASPNWHVYVFWLHNIKYVQINDLNGNVHAAIAATNGTTIVLPMGIDSQNVATAEHALTSSATAASAVQVVYQDANVAMTATQNVNGTTTFAVTQAQPCPELACSGAGVAPQKRQ
ncbi:hypothetical protein EO087_02205 [Dyella sp. M7H15-1]|uniref:hypothetical protein n=1 Tax=Dyella sp. M7H15-1 TaxID=2501295 RepID=UPI00100506CD|nr:hypothetical protein [Dyella sp. M7H15-1]QAU22950.1 hypothetical protein EO087_02205 [Dyella sp. M7H15-1]